MPRCWPLGLLLLAAAARGADLALLGAPSAPASGELAYNREFMSGLLQAFMSPKGVNATRLIEAFNPAPCLQKCMPSLRQLLDGLSTQHELGETKDTVALCRKLESIEECAAASKCDSQLLDLATKSYKFACIDKIESLGDSLKCAREAFSGARADCETGCIVNRAQQQAVDPASLPVDVASLCESSVCLLGCMQRSLNSACLARGSTPSLFNAILATSTSSDDSTLSSLLSGMLPAQCRDVLKTQNNLPEKIAQLASIGKDSVPNSVGKPRVQLTPATTLAPTTIPTTTRTTTTTMTTVATPRTTTSPAHPLLWAPEPVEARLEVDGEVRTLQCRMLDWERRPVAAPSIDRLARLIAQQLARDEPMQMRAADDEDDAENAIFRRWMAGHDADSYRAIGFGARADDGSPIPQMRANSAASRPLPSWRAMLAAGALPFVVYLLD